MMMMFFYGDDDEGSKIRKMKMNLKVTERWPLVGTWVDWRWLSALVRAFGDLLWSVINATLPKLHLGDWPSGVKDVNSI